jgi:hypothetical protein
MVNTYLFISSSNDQVGPTKIYNNIVSWGPRRLLPTPSLLAPIPLIMETKATTLFLDHHCRLLPICQRITYYPNDKIDVGFGCLTHP